MKPHAEAAIAMPRSGIREVMELAAGKEGLIKLHVGEPSFRTPLHIIEAAMQAARDGHTRYTANAGTPALRAAVAARYTPRYGYEVSPEEVLIGTGAVNAIGPMLFSLIHDGDEVLVPDPGWPNYQGQVTLARGASVVYPLRAEHGWLPQTADLEALVTGRTKVLILNNPSNPCGVVWPKATVQAVMAWAERHDLWVITDEIYEDLIYDGEFVPAAPFGRERTIAIGGCSKSYAMTGWRIGWAIAPRDLTALAAKVQEGIVSCPADVSQSAALAALTGPQACVEEMRAAYERRRDLVREMLAPAGLLPTVPEGAFYAMIDFRELGMPSREVVRMLIQEEGVTLAPGTAFGQQAEGMARMSLASSDEELQAGCERIVAFASRHAKAGAVA
ncbi:MAG: pyridoxal phosphate-dependent aminotransferase [Chloroflexota bacterium]